MFRKLYGKEGRVPSNYRANAVNEMLQHNRTALALRLAERYKYFEDAPWCSAHPQPLYRTLAVRYPDARFVLTVRDPQKWWSSVQRWTACGKNQKKSHRGTQSKLKRYAALLGASSTSQEHMVAAFEAHNAAARKFFAEELGQPSRLLEIDLTPSTWHFNITNYPFRVLS